MTKAKRNRYGSETQSRAMALFKAGLQTRADVELRLGDHVARYTPEA